MADLGVYEKSQGMLGDGSQLENAVTCAVHLDEEWRYQKHTEKQDEQADLSLNLGDLTTRRTRKGVERGWTVWEAR